MSFQTMVAETCQSLLRTWGKVPSQVPSLFSKASLPVAGIETQAYN